MKKVLQIVLGLVIVGLAYLLYSQITAPLNFQKEVKVRESAVIKKIIDIRYAEQAYKQVHSEYTGNFDTLIHFVLNDSLEFDRTIGSLDDSAAVAQGLVTTEKFKVAVIDTIFKRKVSISEIQELPLIPYGEGNKYILRAGELSTESGVVVPVFECAAPYKYFLGDLDRQQLINLIDERENVMNRYPGIKVGSMEQATNDAGNWE